MVMIEALLLLLNSRGKIWPLPQVENLGIVFYNEHSNIH